MKSRDFPRLLEQLKGGVNMRHLLSINFWLQLFLSTFMTMVMIYLIKKMNEKVKIPVVNDIVSGV